MKRICVFCGASPGAKPEYTQAAQAFGQLLAQRQLGLVYGGGKNGLMGQVANAALAAGGEVIGVVPSGFLAHGVALTALADLRVVESMHERKALMAELADGFVALPGGIGTLEEFLEILTWAQLGLHHKPCGLLNSGGYYTPFLALLDHLVAEHFFSPPQRAHILVAADPAALLDQFTQYQPRAKGQAWVKG